MRCFAGILHSGLVDNKAVIDSCQMRRLVWGERGERSSLPDRVLS